MLPILYICPMRITKLVYDIENEIHVTNIPPRVKCQFDLFPMGNDYGAFVEFNNPSIKPSAKKHFKGNSLWSIGSKPLQELVKRIEKYDCVQQIIRDFDV